MSEKHPEEVAGKILVMVLDVFLQFSTVVSE